VFFLLRGPDELFKTKVPRSGAVDVDVQTPEFMVWDYKNTGGPFNLREEGRALTSPEIVLTTARMKKIVTQKTQYIKKYFVYY
jgi:hypothetical protein